MRRFLACVVVLLLLLNAGGAAARSQGQCCEGCDDLALCVAAACKACPAQALLPAAPGVVQSAGAAPSFWYATLALDERSTDIWRPPR
jgi:hypothetical protein